MIGVFLTLIFSLKQDLVGGIYTRLLMCFLYPLIYRIVRFLIKTYAYQPLNLGRNKCLLWSKGQVTFKDLSRICLELCWLVLTVLQQIGYCLWMLSSI